MIKREWFYHRTEGGRRGIDGGLCRVDFLWIDWGEYFRITFLCQMS